MQGVGVTGGRLVFPGQQPGRDATDEHRGGEERPADHVGVGGQGRGVGQHGADVGQLGPATRGVEADPDGVLHPGVGRDDEVRRQRRADGRGPDRGQVKLRGEPVPPEDPEPQEGGLEEEGDQGFHRQRGAEDVAHEPGVVGPVHAELELLHDPGDHAHGEVDQEELPEELGETEVGLVAGAVPAGLEPGHHQPQADGQRDHEEVVDGGDPELPTGQRDQVHGVVLLDAGSRGPRVPGHCARASPEPTGP